jgi:hypothetical protein
MVGLLLLPEGRPATRSSSIERGGGCRDKAIGGEGQCGGCGDKVVEREGQHGGYEDEVIEREGQHGGSAQSALCARWAREKIGERVLGQPLDL